MGIDREELPTFIRGPDIGWILLGRPGRFPIIHLLIGFRSKWGRWNKRVSDQFVSIAESITLPIEVDDPLVWLSEETGIGEVPVPRDEKDPIDGCRFNRPLEEGKQELKYKGLLIWKDILIPFRWREGWK